MRTFRIGTVLRGGFSKMSYGLKHSRLQKSCVILSASGEDARRTSSLRAVFARRISTDLKARIACLLRSFAHLLAVATFLVASALPLLADTPSLLRIPLGGCYCHCAESKVRGGCVKMCESRKYAYRWWAATCAKPHLSTPRRDSHAGPRFPHPRRTEHARL